MDNTILKKIYNDVKINGISILKNNYDGRLKLKSDMKIIADYFGISKDYSGKTSLFGNNYLKNVEDRYYLRVSSDKFETGVLGFDKIDDHFDGAEQRNTSVIDKEMAFIAINAMTDKCPPNCPTIWYDMKIENYKEYERYEVCYNDGLNGDKIYPLVRYHPIWKCNFLYLARRYFKEIVGMTQEESNNFLENTLNLIHNPIIHEWSPGDMVIHDVFRTSHSRPKRVIGNRVMYRSNFSCHNLPEYKESS
ncbi:MAG: TauD/TfdA family dioxygenase [Candidimonas sp.]